MTDLKPIRSEQDYNEALLLLRDLWGAETGTADGDKLDILATLIDVYESEHFPIDAPSPEAVSAFLAEEDRHLNEQAKSASVDNTIFEIYTDKHGGFLFRLVKGAGETVFHSEAFSSKAEALYAIRLLQKNASVSEISERAA